MFAIIVTEKGGEQRRLEFDKSEVTIGRVQGNDVILPKGNVSKRHARIVLKDGKFIIVDLKSTNGTYVNGRKITSPLVVKKDVDKIYIGDFIIGVDEAAGARPAGEMAPPPAAPDAFAQRPSEPMPVPDGFSQQRSEPMSVPDGFPQQRSEPIPGLVPNRPTAPAPRPPAPPPPMPGLSLGGTPPPPAPPIPEPPPPAPPPAVHARPRVPEPVAPSRGSGPTSAPARKPDVPPRVGGAAPVRPAAPARPPARDLDGRGPQISPMDEKLTRRLELQDTILEQLIPRLDLDKIPHDRLSEEALWQKAESAIVDLVESLDSSGDLPGFVDQDTLIKESLNEALGLGPLEDLLAEEAIEEILVDRRDRILVSRNGKLTGAGKGFSSDGAFRRVIERLVAPTGQRIDESSPIIDVRLRDGVRLAAAVPPVAVRGACLTLSKPRVRTYSIANLIGDAGMSEAMGDFLTTCVTARRNILVCGAPGSGKSAVLAALASASPAGERIVSVEEVAELSLGREEWVALEARPGDANGVAPVELGTVLRSALRMRADRLIVGEVRGSEAFDLVSAMASAVNGAMVSIAGEGARSALARFTTLSRLGAPGASTDALRHLVASAIEVVVHVARYVDGVVRIASVEEVLGVKDEGFDTREVFGFRGTSATGGFAASGVVPAFYRDLEALGIPADTSIFRG